MAGGDSGNSGNSGDGGDGGNSGGGGASSQERDGVGSGGDPPRNVVLGELLRALNVELDRFNVLFGEAHGLHRTDLHALVTILDAANGQDPMTPSRLAATLNLSASATTALLERLEALGHITREHSTTDRRRVDLDIHDTARQVGGEFYRPLARELRGVWDRFSPDQRDTIEQFLTAAIEAAARARERITPP